MLCVTQIYVLLTLLNLIMHRKKSSPFTGLCLHPISASAARFLVRATLCHLQASARKQHNQHM